MSDLRKEEEIGVLKRVVIMLSMSRLLLGGGMCWKSVKFRQHLRDGRVNLRLILHLYSIPTLHLQLELDLAPHHSTPHPTLPQLPPTHHHLPDLVALPDAQLLPLLLNPFLQVLVLALLHGNRPHQRLPNHCQFQKSLQGGFRNRGHRIRMQRLDWIVRK